MRLRDDQENKQGAEEPLAQQNPGGFLECLRDYFRRVLRDQVRILRTELQIEHFQCYLVPGLVFGVVFPGGKTRRVFVLENLCTTKTQARHHQTDD